MSLLAVAIGLVLLVWSADRFVDGASATARHIGVSPLVIGMLIVGFGTSAPELVVSVVAAVGGNPSLALGNAYGSNIANISLILGLVALLSPIAVSSRVVRAELPLLTAVMLVAALLLWNGALSRTDAVVLLLLFAALMIWSIRQGRVDPAAALPGDALATEMEQELATHPLPLRRAVFWLVVGLLVLVGSSRLLVWGAVTIAQTLGVDDLIIGLTVVATGTSLPELASSIAAIRKGEHDIAIGNVIGSNLFNTLAVVGIAALIHPLSVPAELLYRDWTVMFLLTVALLAMAYGWRGPGRINRLEGGTLLAVYIGYTAWLVWTAIVG